MHRWFHHNLRVRVANLCAGLYGLKAAHGGHDNKWHGNVLAYVDNCYMRVVGGHGYNDAFYDNKCVFVAPTGYSSDCNVSASWEVHDNEVFSRSGSLEVCGEEFTKYVAGGHDRGSSVGKWPTDSVLISMGKKVLGMN